MMDKSGYTEVDLDQITTRLLSDILVFQDKLQNGEIATVSLFRNWSYLGKFKIFATTFFLTLLACLYKKYLGIECLPESKKSSRRESESDPFA